MSLLDTFILIVQSCNPARGWPIIINDVITALVSVWCGCHGNGSALWCGAAVGFHLFDDHVLGYRSVRSCSNSWVQWSRFPDFCPCQSHPIRQKLKETEKIRYLSVADYSSKTFYCYRRNGNCRKVMFSQVSVILSTGGCISGPRFLPGVAISWIRSFLGDWYHWSHVILRGRYPGGKYPACRYPGDGIPGYGIPGVVFQGGSYLG